MSDGDRCLCDSGSTLSIGAVVLQAPLQRDVLDLADEVNGFAAAVMDSRHGERNPDQSTVFANVPFDPVIAAYFSRHQSAQLIEIDCDIVGMRNVGKRENEELILGVTKHLAKRAVDPR